MGFTVVACARERWDREIGFVVERRHTPTSNISRLGSRSHSLHTLNVLSLSTSRHTHSTPRQGLLAAIVLRYITHTLDLDGSAAEERRLVSDA